MEQQRDKYHLAIREHLRSSYLLTEEKIEAVLPRFLDTVQTLMFDLERLATKEKSEALSRTGHAMKGALLNLGLHDLAQKALRIEKHHEAGDIIDHTCGQLVDDLKQEISKIL